MSPKPTARPSGQIRMSQALTTFGPGAMLDLPNHSVLIGGLEFWQPLGEAVVEKRLSDKLQLLLKVPVLQLYAPPAAPDDPTAAQTGITVWRFPDWFITQDHERHDGEALVRSRLLLHADRITKNKYIDLDKRKRPVVSVRFVRACRKGHIGEIDWYRYVHRGQGECRGQLWIDERGTSGDLSEVWVRCACKAERSMGDAALMQTGALGNCDGNRPWLGQYSTEACGEPNRLLIRTASNAYFPQIMSVISLPDRDEKVKQAVDQAWEFLEGVEELEQLQYERRKAKVKAALEGMTDNEVFAEVLARRGTATELPAKPVKHAELETLVAGEAETGVDAPEGNFYARSIPREKWDAPWMRPIGRIVLVHRLREVSALIGFTRFEALAPDTSGEFEIGVQRAAIARETSWLPAIENKGEGIFLQFNTASIEQWLARDDVQRRGRQLESGFKCWLAEHKGSHRKFPGLPYLMLHSFSHLLVTSMSLECGYPASSIRERIYALPGIGYGVLLFTATSDAEGTLGGLVQVGRQIQEHVRAALDLGELCSNDPVCAQHDPSSAHEHRYLQGSACHGCLLIAETSCEQHNDFLDRALVVPTVDHLGIEFFGVDER